MQYLWRYFSAPLPEECIPQKKVRCWRQIVIADQQILHCRSFFRQDTLQSFLGVPLPASTQWDLIKSAVPVMKPVYLALYQLAADGFGFYIDDTHAKILTQMQANKKATCKEERLSHDRYFRVCVKSMRFICSSRTPWPQGKSFW